MNEPKANKAQSRISEAEQSLLRGVFANRDDLLQLLRNVFLGFDLTAEEKQTIQTIFKSESLRKLMRKMFLPEIEKDNPIGDLMAQTVDLWLTVDLKDKPLDAYRSVIETRAILIGMIEVALKRLDDVENTLPIDNWKERPWSEGKVEALVARNNFIVHVNQQVFNIRVLANLKEETPEEAKERMTKNSTK